MKKYLTLKTVASIFSFLFLATVASAQTKYKVGDKVEALYKGVWHKGQVTGFYGPMYTVKEESTGLTFYPDDKEIRSVGGSVSDAKQNEASTARPAIEKNNVPCDWSAWGILGKEEFMNFAKATTGRFATSTSDLLCIVTTRKVNFQLTPQELSTVENLRNSPELIKALTNSYKAGKAASSDKASQVKIGRYACGGRFFQPDLFILSNNSYNTRESQGKYTFSSASNKIEWASGPLGGGSMTGEYFPAENAITVYNTRNQILFSCSWAENK